MVGDTSTGYIVAPYSDKLQEELETRCKVTNRAAATWVRQFKLDLAATG
jgi:predicted RNase H-like nuclease